MDLLRRAKKELGLEADSAWSSSEMLKLTEGEYAELNNLFRAGMSALVLMKEASRHEQLPEEAEM